MATKIDRDSGSSRNGGSYSEAPFFVPKVNKNRVE